VALSRIEKGLDRKFAEVNKAVIGMRDSLQRNVADIQEMRTAWEDGVKKIEESLSRGNTSEAIESRHKRLLRGKSECHHPRCHECRVRGHAGKAIGE